MKSQHNIRVGWMNYWFDIDNYGFWQTAIFSLLAVTLGAATTLISSWL